MAPYDRGDPHTQLTHAHEGLANLPLLIGELALEEAALRLRVDLLEQLLDAFGSGIPAQRPLRQRRSILVRPLPGGVLPQLRHENNWVTTS
jgi:hypothetical protein